VDGLRATVADSVSTVGGGSAPQSELPTRVVTLELDGVGATELETRLRQLDTPLIGRIEHGRLLLDMRTVLPWQDEELAELLRQGLR
jgi:L-seryl-tRNA(Ser) seleniumtransferase